MRFRAARTAFWICLRHLLAFSWRWQGRWEAWQSNSKTWKDKRSEERKRGYMGREREPSQNIVQYTYTHTHYFITMHPRNNPAINFLPHLFLMRGKKGKNKIGKNTCVLLCFYLRQSRQVMEYNGLLFFLLLWRQSSTLVIFKGVHRV